MFFCFLVAHWLRVLYTLHVTKLNCFGSEVLTDFFSNKCKKGGVYSAMPYHRRKHESCMSPGANNSTNCQLRNSSSVPDKPAFTKEHQEFLDNLDIDQINSTVLRNSKEYERLQETYHDIYSSDNIDCFFMKCYNCENEINNMFPDNIKISIKNGTYNLNLSEESSEVSEGYAARGFIPVSSKLSRKDMTQLFHIYQLIISQKSLGPPEDKLYQKFCNIIKEEQSNYKELVHSIWKNNLSRRPNDIKPEVVDYTSKLWKERLDRVQWYSKYFVKLNDIPLMYEDKEPSQLNFIRQLNTLGSSRAFSPYFKFNIHEDISLLGNQDNSFYQDNMERKQCTYKPIASELIDNGFHPQVSCDKVAESKALESDANIVLSTSGFLSIILQNEFDLPVLIKEYPTVSGNQKKRVVFIDNSFPKKTLSAHDRNVWFCKKRLCHILKSKENNQRNRKLTNMNQQFDSKSKINKEQQLSEPQNDPGTSFSNNKMDEKIVFHQNQPSPPHSDSRCIDLDEDLVIADDTIESSFDYSFPIQMEEERPIQENCNVHSNTDNLYPDHKEAVQQIEYNLWSLSNSSCNVMLKENLMELKLLIRCKSGFKFGKNENDSQFELISPKWEYQCEYGAETLSLSEMYNEWCKLFLRPNRKLKRVRLDCVTGNHFLTETKKLIDLSSDIWRTYNVKPQDRFLALHVILNKLMGVPPGSYLLSKDAKLGPFVTLYKSEECRNHTYNPSLKYVSVDTNHVSTTTHVYLPIDEFVITKECLQQKIIPAMFYPKGSKKLQSKLDVVKEDETFKEIKLNVLASKKKKQLKKSLSKKIKQSKQKSQGSTCAATIDEDHTNTDDGEQTYEEFCLKRGLPYVPEDVISED